MASLARSFPSDPGDTMFHRVQDMLHALSLSRGCRTPQQLDSFEGEDACCFDDQSMASLLDSDDDSCTAPLGWHSDAQSRSASTVSAGSFSHSPSSRPSLQMLSATASLQLASARSQGALNPPTCTARRGSAPAEGSFSGATALSRRTFSDTFRESSSSSSSSLSLSLAFTGEAIPGDGHLDGEVKPSRAREMLLHYQSIARSASDEDYLPPWLVLLMQELDVDSDDTRSYLLARNVPCAIQRLLREILQEQPRNAVEVIEDAVATLHQSMLHRHPHAAVTAALAAVPRRPRPSGLFASQRIPTLEELAAIRSALHDPPLLPDERAILWDFRWYLAGKAEGLPSILHAVDWANTTQVTDALKLAQNWGFVRLEEALELLAYPWDGHPEVRTAALSGLQALTDEELLGLFPQLVQALRYETPMEGCSLLNFLIQTASKGFDMASALTWHLGVEAAYFPAFRTAQELFLLHLCNSPATNGWVTEILVQMNFARFLSRLYNKVRNYNGKDRAAYLAQLLEDKEFFDLDSLIAKKLCLPLNPRIVITGVVPHLSHAFGSAQHPILLAFTVNFPDKVTKLIFKKGDDLRQDQLVCQLIRLIHRLWREEGLDLRLTPYRVLATDREEGMVQVVPRACSLSHVLKQKGGIRAYLREHNYSYSAPDHIDPQALDNYVRSSAGYCIITYVLGIGDRHLDNILLCPDGRLLHIDFGYMFGRDPKPFPPPMKLSRDMLEALGGPRGQLCQQLVEHCWAGYRILRQNGRLLSQLMVLMRDSELRCLNVEVSRQNLRLDLDEGQAKAHIQQVVYSSMSAFIPEIMDVIHDVAMWLK